MEGRAYFLNAAGVIMRAKTGPISDPPGPTVRTLNSEANCTDLAISKPFTADEVIVDQLLFTLHGQTVGSSDGQPWVTISLKIHSSDPRIQTAASMNLQTTVVQRLRDAL